MFIHRIKNHFPLQDNVNNKKFLGLVPSRKSNFLLNTDRNYSTPFLELRRYLVH